MGKRIWSELNMIKTLWLVAKASEVTCFLSLTPWFCFKFMLDRIADHQRRVFIPILTLASCSSYQPGTGTCVVCWTMEETTKQQHLFPLKKSIFLRVLGGGTWNWPSWKEFFLFPSCYSDQAETWFFITGREWVQLPLSAVSVLKYS